MNIFLTPDLIEEYRDWLIDFRSAKPRTIDVNKKRLTYLAHYLKNKPFNQEGCTAYLVYLREEGKEPATRASTRYVMKSFCQFLSVKDPLFVDFIQLLPKIKVMEKPIEVLSVEEINAILTYQRNYRYKGLQEFWDTLLSLIARTGRRVGEIQSLKVADLNPTQSAILLRAPKNSQPQWIPIPKEIMEQLVVMAEGKKPDEYIFVNDFTGDKPISTVSIRNEVRKRARLVGIQKRVHPHLLRHSFPIEILRKKVPLVFVQRLMGHKRIESTLRYIHMVLDDLRVAATQHPLNQAELTALEVVKCIEAEVNRYSLSERGDLDFEVNHKPREFNFTIRW